MRVLAVLTVAALVACTGAASAPTGPATPATLMARLKSAKGGETIRLAPGDYGIVNFPREVHSPAITIDASGATFTGLVLNKVGGVTIRGGQVVGPGGRSYGISIRGSERVRIENMRISGAHRGIVTNESRDIALVGNALTGLVSDGIDVASSQRVLVQRNSCRDFSPNLAVFDAAGKKVRDGDHPDCIQGWSRSTLPPTSDVQVLDNVIEGRMQGIFFGNHVRNGVDDGGFDRIVIRGNKVTVNMNGIVLSGARGGHVRDNKVELWPELPFPERKNFRLRPSIRLLGEGIVACGNVVLPVPRAPGQGPCGTP
ncbi:right-handed parallel beta-helix repeat-containing protein [Sphingomonas corticis]|uniref:Right handed beta helix domain-containing protein n=1 Tax=Sphingomonas corticis TaxID=2722791 RepID=A0ABX1CN18_9SPHN|nr:right-handed parallel beta-helix repeat-containing protein [Sphingomonas corticis]NJR79371.1 hypothetical protein [Sphingomonas corticis]